MDAFLLSSFKEKKIMVLTLHFGKKQMKNHTPNQKQISNDKPQSKCPFLHTFIKPSHLNNFTKNWPKILESVN